MTEHVTEMAHIHGPAAEYAHAPWCTPTNPCSSGLCDGTVEHLMRNTGGSAMTNGHKVTTTTETSRWGEDAWVPAERVVRVETHQEFHAPEREHVVSDTEECWCEPVTVSVTGANETERPDSCAEFEPADVADLLGEVMAERYRQHEKWGQRNHPNGTGRDFDVRTAEAQREACDRAFRDGWGTWSHILREEVAEANAESNPGRLRTELLQVAAVAVAWIEAIDRRLTTTTRADDLRDITRAAGPGSEEA